MKTLPTSETKAPGVECKRGDETFVITSNADRTRFTLWREDSGYQKIQTADSPATLYDAIYGKKAKVIK